MPAIAACNNPADQPDRNGHSTVFDGASYLPELSESRDTCLLETGMEEGAYIADSDVDMLCRYHEKEVHGNAYRKPDKYSILLEDSSLEEE